MNGSFPRVGAWAWSFVGVVVATIIVVTALAAVSEIVLPLLFAAVLAVVFKPLVGKLERRKLKPTLAAGLVVLGLLGLMIVVVVATARGVIDQTGRDQRVGRRSAGHGSRASSASIRPRWTTPRAAAEETGPAIAEGFLTKVVAGIDALVGLAAGLILAALIMYYLLKDGTKSSTLRRRAGRPPRAGTRSTASSATPAGSSATMDAAAPSCPPSWRRSSASPAYCSASRSCSPSSS